MTEAEHTRATRGYMAWLALAAAVAVLDQLTKWWALAALDAPVALLPFLNLVLVHNTGAAFGLLAEAGGWQRWFFIAVTIAVVVFVVGWLRHGAKRGDLDRLFATGLSLVLGGALGNLWDRIARGAVVDFIDLHYARYHWPAFNIADAAIVVGAALLLWAAFRPTPTKPDDSS